jgi:hypothetical protein
MHAIHLSIPAVGVDPEAVGLALERRLQARVARADSAVEITTELLGRWAHEELETILAEMEALRDAAHARTLS